MNINEQKAASKICEIIPVLDNKEHEMLLSYAAGMIAQKKLEEKKAVGDRTGVSSDKNTAWEWAVRGR